MTAHARILPKVEDLDPVSQRLLPVLRHFLSALNGDAPAAWRIAYATAVEVWGEARGLAIAHRAQEFLSAIARRRPVPLRHADPLCPLARLTLSEDEFILLAALTHMRADETAYARDMIMALMCGRVDAGVVRTGLTLAAVLDGPHGAQRSQGPATLTVVSG